MRLKLLNLNTYKPEIILDPNTPLFERLYYEMLTQNDADDSGTQIMLQIT